MNKKTSEYLLWAIKISIFTIIAVYLILLAIGYLMMFIRGLYV